MSDRLWPVVVLLFLGACADTSFEQSFERKAYRAHAPFFFINNEPPTAGEVLLEDEDSVYRPMAGLNLAEDVDRRRDGGAGYIPDMRLPAGCSLRDRFDRDGALAYNFSDGQSRLSLHMDMGNVGFGGVEVDKVMIKFRYKFQDGVSSRKERCRYPSGFQGLIGSGYNEFFLRKNDTVWDALRDANPLGLF